MIGIILSVIIFFNSPYKSDNKVDFLFIFFIILFFIILVSLTIISLLIPYLKDKLFYIILLQILVALIIILNDDYNISLYLCSPIFFILEYFFLYRNWKKQNVE